MKSKPAQNAVRSPLREYSQNGREYSLDELVEAANALLPRHLPDAVESSDARFSESVNARLVRHLTTLGLLDEPTRQGREARYGARHLKQLLATRRLMAEGYNTGAVAKLLSGASDEQLETIFLGGSTPAAGTHPLQAGSTPGAARAFSTEAMPGNAALEFLQRVQSRKSGGASAKSRASPDSSQAGSTPVSTRWQRISLTDDLEIQMRDDFQFPPTAYEREQLLERIEAALKNLAAQNSFSQRRKK
jgi:DNA-binding transcriptional MerR regulator